jgi:hypothetical protein
MPSFFSMFRDEIQFSFVFSQFQLIFFLTDLCCCSVKIQKITVPSFVVMDYNQHASGKSKLLAPDFLLDCDYEVGENDTNLVVKWLLTPEGSLKPQLIYQWIPPRAPTERALLKNRIKKNYTITDDPKKMYRAIMVTRPSVELSGEYTCSVETFQSSDKKSSFLQVIGE